MPPFFYASPMMWEYACQSIQRALVKKEAPFQFKQTGKRRVLRKIQIDVIAVNARDKFRAAIGVEVTFRISLNIFYLRSRKLSPRR